MYCDCANREVHHTKCAKCATGKMCNKKRANSITEKLRVSDGGVEQGCCTGQGICPVSVFVAVGLNRSIQEKENCCLSLAGGESGRGYPEQFFLASFSPPQLPLGPVCS